MTKTEIRKKLLEKRNSLSMEYRESADSEIFRKLITHELYNDSDLILIYVSSGSEIDTRDIISYTFKNNKRVAVPHCADGIMSFYEIHSTDELVRIQFGIPTVDVTGRIPVNLTEKTLCIVPALSIDSNGNRLGYGGGYYDKFLGKNNIEHICLIRKDFISEIIPSEEFDFVIKNYITD